MNAPDSILAGKVVTLDDAGSVAEALAIRDGRVLAVGTRADIFALRGPETEFHDFETAAVIPGFNDTHAHMDTEGLKRIRPSLEGARSIADIQARIAALAAETPPDAWIVTMPFGEPPHFFDAPASLAEGRPPTREELDRAAPEHPVCILPPSGYWGKPPCYTILNSKALAANGIGPGAAPRLPGIEILCDRAGAPTGVIVDHNPRESAQLDLLPNVPGFDEADRAAGVAEAMRLYHTKGTTSIYEGHGCSPLVMGIYQDLCNRGELTMRVGMVINPAWAGVEDAAAVMPDLVHARGRGLGDDMLRVSGIHIGYGGDPLAARLAREQGDDTGYWSFHWHAFAPEEFEAICMLAAEHDVRVHTIASAGKQEEVIPILERVDRGFPLAGRRWVLEHVSLCRDEDIAAMKAMGLGVTVIPLHHLWKNGAAFFDLTQGQADLVVPVKAARAAGLPIAAGTDNTPYDPLGVMQAMMVRTECQTGRVIGKGGRLDAETALRALTEAGAWFTFDEGRKGRLVPGQLADCAVLSANPLTTSPEALTEIDCIATVVGGTFVHGP